MREPPILKSCEAGWLAQRGRKGSRVGEAALALARAPAGPALEGLMRRRLRLAAHRHSLAMWGNKEGNRSSSHARGH
jgi:hypothetical protein